MSETRRCLEEALTTLTHRLDDIGADARALTADWSGSADTARFRSLAMLDQVAHDVLDQIRGLWALAALAASNITAVDGSAVLLFVG